MNNMPDENIFLLSQNEVTDYVTRWGSKERKTRAKEIVENPNHPLHVQYLELMSAIAHIEHLIIDSMDNESIPLDRQATGIAAINLIAKNI